MDVEDHACPGAGACGGQFTANTMATAYEMLGISPMGWNDVPAVDPRKEEIAFECGKLVMEPASRKASRRARSSPARASRTPSPASWRPAARPTPCCTCWRSAGGRRQALDRRVRSRSRARRRCWPTSSRGATSPRPRCTRPAAWRWWRKRLLEAGLIHDEEHDGHGPHDRRGGAGGAETPRPEGDHAAGRRRSSRGRHRHPARQPRARRAAWPRCRARSKTSHRGPARVFDREEDAFAAVKDGQDQAQRRRS